MTKERRIKFSEGPRIIAVLLTIGLLGFVVPMPAQAAPPGACEILLGPAQAGTLANYEAARTCVAQNFMENSWTQSSWEEFGYQESMAQTAADGGRYTEAIGRLSQGVTALRQRGNETALLALLAAAPAPGDADRYTPDTWNAYAPARAMAEIVAADNADRDQSEIDAAAAALGLAAAQLALKVPAALANLITLVEAVEALGLDPDQFTPESWAALEAALAAAKAAVGPPPASEAAQAAATAALQDAVAGLAPAPDRSRLDALIAAAQSLAPRSDLWVADLWDNVSNALAAATGLPNHPAQALIDSAADNLANALDALAPVARLEGLDALLDAIAAVGPNQPDYTPASWTPYAQALAQAEALGNRDPATVNQAEVDAAIDALKDAWLDLAPITLARLEGLDAILDAVAAVAPSEPDYTPASWAPYAQALAQAVALRNRNPATISQAEVDAAIAALKDGWSNLTPVPITRWDGLNAMLDAISALNPNESSFTPESWAAYLEALRQLEALRDRDPATVSQAELDAAIAALQEALAQLVPLPSEVFVDLADAIAAAERLRGQSDKFTDDTWQAVAAA
ncbi:MAG: FIVAR domain-containing protein, partial [Bifidobacteriaceae bacterium]|nr:FIVAR domain-containing protein [Bifidobacteriaceae bacterium]